MKSITEIANQFNVSTKELNDMLMRNGIYVSTTFGINDGYIEDELYTDLCEQYNQYQALLLPAEEIINNKSIVVPIKKAPYIYFLLEDNIIVYVGQSYQLLARLQNHVDNDNKVFNAVTVIEVSRKTINIYEKLYINRFNPSLNKKKYSILEILDHFVKAY